MDDFVHVCERRADSDAEINPRARQSFIIRKIPTVSVVVDPSSLMFLFLNSTKVPRELKKASPATTEEAF